MTSLKKLLLAGAAVAVVSPTAIGSALAQDDLITFSAILADPSNLELNLAYAEQRIDAGDLLAAAATLERVLILQPNWDDARLLYASVLYRLGDTTAAEREIDLLEGRDLSEEAMAELRQYQQIAKSSNRLTRISGNVSLGFSHDGSAGTQVAEDAGNLGNILASSGVIARAGLTITRDLSESVNLKGFAKGDVYVKEFLEDDLEGFSIANVTTGLSGGGSLRWELAAHVRDTKVGGEDYLLEYGPQVRLTQEITPKTKLTLNAAYHEQEYDSVFGAGDGFAEARDGNRTDLGLTLGHDFSSLLRGSVGVAYRDKTADLDEFAYEYIGGQVGLTQYFREGGYATSTLLYRDYEYAAGGREDEFYYFRAAVGAPFREILDVSAGSVADKLTAEFAVNYANRQSTIDVFDYDNTGIEGRVIYRFSK